MNRTSVRDILSPITLGSMRFSGPESAAETIAACHEEGVNYVDCSPGYGMKSPQDNSESWVGAALAAGRGSMLLSTKCSPGNGGLEIGEEFRPEHGFGVRSADQLRQVMEQSMRRLQVDRFDCYQLWTVHNMTQFDEARKPGGWLEGALQARADGVFRHLGVTTHADSATIIEFLSTGLFEMVTLPYHLLDTTREEAIRWAAEHDIAVLAMNPLGGGILAGESDLVRDAFSDLGANDPAELALRFVLSTPGLTTALVGMISADEVRRNTAVTAGTPWTEKERAEALRRFRGMSGDGTSKVCTGCRYCGECPQGLDIPRLLGIHSAYYALGLKEKATERCRAMVRWGASHDPSSCTACGTCEARCPNSLPVASMMEQLAVLSRTTGEA